MKNTFKYVKVLTAVVASFAMLAMVGCESDSHYISPEYRGDGSIYGDDGELYAIFGESNMTETTLVITTDGYIGSSYAGKAIYDMYTNAPHWTLEADYSECHQPNVQWIKFWPSFGHHDGRFEVTFMANSVQGDTRYANIYIKSGDTILRTIRVEQAQALITTLEIQPFLLTQQFKMEDSAVKTIPVTANVHWTARVDDDANGDPVDWVKISGLAFAKFDISVLPNTTGVDRQATITVYQNTNGNKNMVVTVKQAGTPEQEPTPDPAPTPDPEPGQGEGGQGEGGQTDGQ